MAAVSSCWLLSAEHAVADQTLPNDAERVNELGYELLKAKVEEGRSNICLSPASAAYVLGAMQNGAAGGTKRQMDEVLGDLSNFFNIMASYRVHYPPHVLDHATMLLYDKKRQLSDPFKGQLKSKEVETGKADFRRNPVGIERDVNQWVVAKTKGRIKHIFPAGTITPDHAMILVNAIYFRGFWMSPFNPLRTDEGRFRSVKGTVPAQYMVKEGRYGCVIGQGDCTVLVMPYTSKGKGRMLMAAMLPRDDMSVNELLNKMTWAKMEDMVTVAMARSQDLVLSFPKFSLSADVEDLKAFFGKLGIKDAFTPGKADFKGVFEDQSLVWIDHVYHRCTIAVGERGTTASAVTAVDDPFGPAPEPVRTRVTFDKPFVWLIYDYDNRLLLFCGTLDDPSAR